MVVIQSLMDNLCRCICTTDLPSCGEMSFRGGSSSGHGSRSQSPEDVAMADAERIDAKMAAAAGGGNRAHLNAHHRDSNIANNNRCGTPCSMAAGLSTAESGAAAAATAVSGMAAKLRGSMVECSPSAATDSLFRPRSAAGGGAAPVTAGAEQQGVPATVSSDVSSHSSGINVNPNAHNSPPRKTNSVETAEDREAKEALARARKEAGRVSQQSGRSRKKAAASASSRARSRSRSGKRKADIFRSRKNSVTNGSPGRARAGKAALADDENADETDDEIVGLRHRRGGLGTRGIFNCVDDSPSRRSTYRAADIGRMMLCFATPVHGSDSDEEEQAHHNQCCQQNTDSPVGSRRGRKAARTSEQGEYSRRQDHSQDNRSRGSNKVRTIADDMEELEAMQAERERLERQEEALRNGEPVDRIELGSDTDLVSHDETTATNADETITSTLYFDAKLGEVVDRNTSGARGPQLPMPLFNHFKVDVDEEKDDEIRKIVRSGSHRALSDTGGAGLAGGKESRGFSIMQMWKQSMSQESSVLRATPTAKNVVGALGIKEGQQQGQHGKGRATQAPAPAPAPQAVAPMMQTAPASPPRQTRHHHPSRQRGPPVVRQVTPPEREASSRFATAPRAPMLHRHDKAKEDERLGASPRRGQGIVSLDFTGETTSSSSASSRGRRQRRSARAQVISAEV